MDCTHGPNRTMIRRFDVGSYKDPGECAQCVLIERDSLRAQLAAVTKERDAANALLAEAESGAVHVNDELRELRAQLAAVTSRLAEAQKIIDGQNDMILTDLRLLAEKEKMIAAVTEDALRPRKYPEEKPETVLGDWIVKMRNGRTRHKMVYSKKSWEGVTHWLPIPPMASK